MPFGGYGLMLSKGAIANLIQPIYCENSTSEDTKNSQLYTLQNKGLSLSACKRLEQNLVGEKEFFEDGMSLSDLMDAQASTHSYADFPNKTTEAPYCFHSDMATGYYLSHYEISNHVSEFIPNQTIAKIMEGRYQFRIGWNMGGLNFNGTCKYRNQYTCNAERPLCHRIKPKKLQWLKEQTQGSWQ
jgi:hypothetical protein